MLLLCVYPIANINANSNLIDLTQLMRDMSNSTYRITLLEEYLKHQSVCVAKTRTFRRVDFLQSKN